VADVAVRVKGAKELRKTLKGMDERGVLKELGKVNNRIASVVVSRAQGNAGTAMERSAAGRLRAGKGATKATVTLGGKPYDLGAEFGARRNVVRTRKVRVATVMGTAMYGSGTYLGLNQFKDHRGTGERAGYFLYPAIRESRDEIIDQYGDEIDRLFRKGA